MIRFWIKVLGIIIFSALFFGCSQEKSNAIKSTDLAGKQTLLTEKKKELRKLEAEVEKLQHEVKAMVPKIDKAKIPVYVNQLEKRTFTSYATIQGNIASVDVVNASSETGGRILNLFVNEGDYVNAGQAIATMDVVTMQKQLEEVQTSYNLAKTVFERQERLWNQKIGSELQFLEAKNNVERLEKNMATMQSQLGKKNITAPISGYIDQVIMKQGEMASPGMPIVQILNTGTLKIVAEIPEVYLASVKKGEYVDVFLPAIDKEMKKRVTMVGRTIDPANRTFKIEMETSNPGNVLKPNLLAEVTIKDKVINNAVIIPVDIIKQDVAGDRYVFVAKEVDGKKVAKKVVVESGNSYLNETIIESGLDGSELLITAGTIDLSDGAEIMIEERQMQENEKQENEG